MNVVHINSYFVSNTLHYELVKELAEHNQSCKQWVYVALNKSQKTNNYPEIKNVKLWISPLFSTLERYIWPLKIRAMYRDFINKVEGVNIDLIHAHSLISNGLLAYNHYKKTGTPYIVTVRNTDINIFMKKSALFRWLGYKILESASAVVVLSPAYKEIQLKSVLSSNRFSNIEHKVKVIPNGVDNFWIKNRKAKLDYSNELQILFVGKLRENKNILGLIEACKHLKSKGIEFKLHIVGDGKLMDKVKEATRDINCSIYGFISDKERLLDLYRVSDLLVVPSFKESFGLIYAEAMTQGLPVIYTKGQGFDGNFPDGYIGYSIDPNSSESISEAIIRVQQNIQEISNNAYENSEFFSWTHNSTTLNELYKSFI